MQCYRDKEGDTSTYIIQLYRDTRIRKYKDTDIQGYIDTRYRDKDTRIQDLYFIQRYKDTEIKIQGFKETTVYYIDTRITR